jgi:hypothetical protein
MHACMHVYILQLQYIHVYILQYDMWACMHARIYTTAWYVSMHACMYIYYNMICTYTLCMNINIYTCWIRSVGFCSLNINIHIQCILKYNIYDIFITFTPAGLDQSACVRLVHYKQIHNVYEYKHIQLNINIYTCWIRSVGLWAFSSTHLHI